MNNNEIENVISVLNNFEDALKNGIVDEKTEFIMTFTNRIHYSYDIDSFLESEVFEDYKRLFNENDTKLIKQKLKFLCAFMRWVDGYDIFANVDPSKRYYHSWLPDEETLEYIYGLIEKYSLKKGYQGYTPLNSFFPKFFTLLFQLKAFLPSIQHDGYELTSIDLNYISDNQRNEDLERAFFYEKFNMSDEVRKQILVKIIKKSGGKKFFKKCLYAKKIKSDDLKSMKFTTKQLAELIFSCFTDLTGKRIDIGSLSVLKHLIVVKDLITDDVLQALLSIFNKRGLSANSIEVIFVLTLHYLGLDINDFPGSKLLVEILFNGNVSL